MIWNVKLVSVIEKSRFFSSIHNTLYLEVHCPAVKPELVVISDNGRQTTDYGDVSIGQSVTKSITIHNISDRTIDVSFENKPII